MHDASKMRYPSAQIQILHTTFSFPPFSIPATHNLQTRHISKNCGSDGKPHQACVLFGKPSGSASSSNPLHVRATSCLACCAAHDHSIIVHCECTAFDCVLPFCDALVLVGTTVLCEARGSWSVNSDSLGGTRWSLLSLALVILCVSGTCTLGFALVMMAV